MAEKGGRMFSMPQKKPSLKSSAGKDAPLKGKDDTPARSRLGKNVQFNSENGDKTNFTSKTGKDAPRFPKAGASSTGKGEKAASNNKKTFDIIAPQSMDLKIGDEFPKNVTCLMACEAADILQGIQEHMTFLSKDPNVKSPISFDSGNISFDSGIQYARKRSGYTNSKSVRNVLDKLKKHRVTDGEICVIADICPETIDEVFALVPSLKGKKEKLSGPLETVLDELSKLKEPALDTQI